VELPAGKLVLNEDGALAQLAFSEVGGWNEVLFRSDEFRGPSWFVDQDGRELRVSLHPEDQQTASFAGELDNLHLRLDYQLAESKLIVRASVHNSGPKAFAPVRCGIKLGLDTYMIRAPDWDRLYFPTLLRCEKNHFWGYCMSPLGRILGIASPDPIASWSMDYNFTLYGSHRHEGHRIYTFNLDLLNALPLPSRHPQNLTQLLPGESRAWTIFVVPISSLEQVKPTLADLCAAPMIHCERHTLAAGETARLQVFSTQASSLALTQPDGASTLLQSDSGKEGWSHYSFVMAKEPGVYTLVDTNAEGKQSEAKLYVRQPWSWYLKQARREALNKPQKASTHMESWLGFFSAFLARKHFPDRLLDQSAEAHFREVLLLMFDIDQAQPIVEAGRIQNTACMLGLLADLYEAGGKLEDLDLAARLADWLLQSQDAAGAYRASADYGYGTGMHYTSVAYMAKYMLELAQTEQRLAPDDPLWKERYERHYRSARAAIDDLENLRDTIGTEGEPTFEDGMISCTAAQLAQFAWMQADPLQRQKYASASQQVWLKHRCLEQILIPDCRMNGATLRFWEAQYDVLIKHNMLSSPHGWTSWKTYATWYLYLLSGEEELLRQTMDTLGACMQVINLDQGGLRWGFISDPYVPTSVFQPDPEHSNQGQRHETVLGEQYIEMISGWWQASPGKSTGGYWGQGGCCDNDVHEHFKCLEEVALTSAYVLERKNGQLISWNCTVQFQDGMIHIFPLEEVVSAVHVNINRDWRIEVHFGEEIVRSGPNSQRMFWIRKKDSGK
jgi:hypothetical protein